MTDSPKVAFLGPPGTFSQAAVLLHFGQGCEGVPVSTIEDAFSGVEAGSVDYAVVPVENSTEGVVNNTQDCLVETSARITGEVILAIEHHFLVGSNTDAGTIREIASHRQSLAQCRLWIRRHYPEVPIRECVSNAEAAILARDNPGVAAIAGQLAADTYGLTILESAIQDQQHNRTRFLVLGGEPVPATGRDKTSMLVYAANRPGALFHVLEPFERLQISLTKIDSRPAKKAAWEYVFFIDFEGHQDDAIVRDLLARLKTCTEEVKLLGSYPACSEARQP
ncbi:MAG: prephenate dehydratase [Pseudohongiellaceae bacterium]